MALVPLAEAVRDRLVARVPALGGRVRAAADLAALQRAGAWPGQTPAAHVLHFGIDGGAEVPLTPGFRQQVRRSVAIVLTIRGHDPTGAAWLDRIEDLLAAILAAFVGWQPPGVQGVVTLAREGTVAFEGGTMVRQILLTVTDTMETQA
jgi:hypothetical protein